MLCSGSYINPLSQTCNQLAFSTAPAPTLCDSKTIRQLYFDPPFSSTAKYPKNPPSKCSFPLHNPCCLIKTSLHCKVEFCIINLVAGTVLEEDDGVQEWGIISDLSQFGHPE